MKPWIIAHGRAAAYAPENTKASIKRAIEMGVDAIEFDVQMSKDGHFIVMHDYNLKRTTGTNALAKDLTLKQIRKLDCGHYFGKQYIKEKIPTLDEILKIVGNKLPVFLDVKDKYADNPAEWAKKLQAELKKGGITHATMGGEFHRIDPFITPGKHVTLSYYDLKNPWPWRKIKNRYDNIRPHTWLCNRWFVRAAHRHNIKIYPWAPKTRRKTRKLVLLGVDGLFMNQPTIMREVLNALNKSSAKGN